MGILISYSIELLGMHLTSYEGRWLSSSHIGHGMMISWGVGSSFLLYRPLEKTDTMVEVQLRNILQLDRSKGTLRLPREFPPWDVFYIEQWWGTVCLLWKVRKKMGRSITQAVVRIFPWNLLHLLEEHFKKQVVWVLLVMLHIGWRTKAAR